MFRSWQRSGGWEAILSALQICAEAAGDIVWEVSVDSTIPFYTHQHAAGACRREIFRSNHPAGSPSSRLIMVWGALAAGGPRNCTIVAAGSGEFCVPDAALFRHQE